MIIARLPLNWAFGCSFAPLSCYCRSIRFTALLLVSRVAPFHNYRLSVSSFTSRFIIISPSRVYFFNLFLYRLIITYWLIHSQSLLFIFTFMFSSLFFIFAFGFVTLVFYYFLFCIYHDTNTNNIYTNNINIHTNHINIYTYNINIYTNNIYLYIITNSLKY